MVAHARKAILQSHRVWQGNIVAEIFCKERLSATTKGRMKYLRFIRLLKNTDAPWRLIFKCVLTFFILYFEFTVARPAFSRGGGDSMFGLMTTLILALGINILWRNAIIDFICSPLTNLFTGGTESEEKKPQYSSATAKRKRGRYDEAIAEVRRQLDRFPNDLEGLLLLAGIQAEDMKDMPAAENTLNRFCDRPQSPLNLVATTFNQLADWHLKIADVDSARAAFQKIVARFPGTVAALQAEQRLAHLGETEKIISAQRDRQNIAMPEGVRNIGLLDSTVFLRPKEIDPSLLAAAHVKHLEAHPHDSEEREKLATIYARDLRRLDLATMELDQLVNEPNHTPKQVAHWLNLLANFQIELGSEVAVVRETLEKIIERFTDLPVAEIAQRRLALLNNEFKGRQETTVVKLGVYEQNLGLKYGSPRKL
jgi:tetratricopeptide (TPR) repeat protein